MAGTAGVAGATAVVVTAGFTGRPLFLLISGKVVADWAGTAGLANTAGVAGTAGVTSTTCVTGSAGLIGTVGLAGRPLFLLIPAEKSVEIAEGVPGCSKFVVEIAGVGLRGRFDGIEWIRGFGTRGAKSDFAIGIAMLSDLGLRPRRFGSKGLNFSLVKRGGLPASAETRSGATD